MIFPNKDSTRPFRHFSLKEEKTGQSTSYSPSFGKSRGLFWGERLEEKGSATLSINFSDFWKISAFGWRLVSFSVWSTWRGGSLSGKGSDLCKMSRAFLLRGGGIPITLEPRNRLYVWRRTRYEWWLWGINTI